MNQEAFWMVWCPIGSAPSKRHDTEEGAIAEAERLARINPGREFYVLVAIEGRRCMDGMQRVRLDSSPF